VTGHRFGRVAGCYALAALANLLIPKLARAHTLSSYSLRGILRDFGQALRKLFFGERCALLRHWHELVLGRGLDHAVPAHRDRGSVVVPSV
jgi:hypothetical protein